MEGTDSLLYEAAREGDTTTLLKLLEQDRLILVRALCMNRLSHKTPLHVAAYFGRANFVKEILSQKPELAEELDSRQSSPLHIASVKGFVDIVRELLKVNPDMCLARDVDGRNPLHLAAMKGYVHIVSALLQVNPDMCLARDVDGRNPFHLAAMNGRIDVLKELVRFRPLAASATTLCGETALHLCVKHQQLEALKLLLGNTNGLHHLLNSKDDCGMTILHLAAAEKRIEVIQFLTRGTKIEVNALNANGFTALDILIQSKRDIKDGPIYQIYRLLKDAKAVQGIRCLQDDWLEKMRNAILVVASLIATVAFQAAVNPPRSPSEDKIKSEMDWIAWYLHSLKKSFALFNTIAFLASVSTILMLISGLPLNRKVALWVFMIIMWAAITAVTFTYMTALKFLDEDELYSVAPSSFIVFIWVCVTGLLVLSHITRGTIKVIKYVVKKKSKVQMAVIV